MDWDPMALTSMSSPVAASRNFIGTTTLAGKAHDSKLGCVKTSKQMPCFEVVSFFSRMRDLIQLPQSIFLATGSATVLIGHVFCLILSCFCEDKTNTETMHSLLYRDTTESQEWHVCQREHCYDLRNAPKQQHLAGPSKNPVSTPTLMGVQKTK